MKQSHNTPGIVSMATCGDLILYLLGVIFYLIGVLCHIHLNEGSIWFEETGHCQPTEGEQHLMKS